METKVRVGVERVTSMPCLLEFDWLNQWVGKGRKHSLYNSRLGEGSSK